MIVRYDWARLLSVPLTIIVFLASAPSPAPAQALPGYSGPGTAAEAEWLRSARLRAEQGLQD